MRRSEETIEIFRPELLAPAGNLETAVAALSAGADAIYLGLDKFNARNRAENFTPDNLARLIDHARQLGRKVYVTFNTLVTEPELPEAMTALAELARLEPDAVIVQDFGILHLLRRYFPQLPVHASTQMGIHNSAGVREAAKLGIKRVILERQLTLEELRRIAAESPIELEVFIHGSLCVSLSGRCLLSEFAEQSSGNRGLCRQLCRRLYHWENGEGFPLSPRDFIGLPALPELSRMRIASLKIEGRLRGPDYVFPVVAAYRKAIDALPKTTPEAAAELARVISRPAETGTLYGFSGLVAPEIPGIFGRRVGRIETVVRRGMRISVEERFHLGDRLRVAGPAGESAEGFLLTALESADGKQLTAARNGETVWIAGRFPGVQPGMALYKSGENGFDFSRRAAALPEAKRSLALQVTLAGGALTVEASFPPGFRWRQEGFEPARQRAWTESALAEELSKPMPGPWRAIPQKITVEGEWFCPAGALKIMRRELHAALVEAMDRQARQPEPSDLALLRFHQDYMAKRPETGTAVMPEQVLTIPGFVAEADLPRWRDRVRRAWREGVRCFRLGGLHALEFIRELPPEDLMLQAVWPWPAANSAATELLRELGLQSLEPWAELPQPALAELNAHSALPLLPQPPTIALLATRMTLPPLARITDRQQRTFRIVRDAESGLTLVLAEGDVLPIFRANDRY